jgi:hypothetical protein
VAVQISMGEWLCKLVRASGCADRYRRVAAGSGAGVTHSVGVTAGPRFHTSVLRTCRKLFSLFCLSPSRQIPVEYLEMGKTASTSVSNSLFTNCSLCSARCALNYDVK